MGEVLVGRKAGGKGALWGAICGTIPDLDFVFGAFMNDVDKNVFHRSVSHSLLFFVLASPITGWLIHRIHSAIPVSFREWSWMAFWAYFTHSLLDCFTTWGTQLFWPITEKVAFKSVFVIDPLYTVPFLILLVLALRLPKESMKRKKMVLLGIGISTFYLCFTLVAKYSAEQYFADRLASDDINAIRMETKPAPFTTFLWAATIETEKGYYLGYHSFFDQGDAPFQFVQKNDELLDGLALKPAMKQLFKLTEGWYTVEQDKGELYLNDLRFGTLSGWEEGGNFVFSYHLIKKEDGKLEVKERKKRLKQSPFSMLTKLLKRISGSF